MQIQWNSQTEEVSEYITLFDALARKGLQNRQGIAVAINGEVISRADWQSKVLQPRDTVLVIQATQGG